MNIGHAATQSGLTVRAVRYYGSIGLVVPARRGNGYRDYELDEVRQLQEIRALSELGLPAEQMRPFLECLALGHAEADDCPVAPATPEHEARALIARGPLRPER